MIADMRGYWSDGRGTDLLRFVVLSYSIAAAEWLLDPTTC
jgi:hypothetical protein